MEKEVRILNQEQIDAFGKWRAEEALQREACERQLNGDNAMKLWLKDNPCPLPPPVKVLDEKRYKNTQHASENTDYYNGFEAGYNACLSDLGLK